MYGCVSVCVYIPHIEYTIVDRNHPLLYDSSDSPPSQADTNELVPSTSMYISWPAHTYSSRQAHSGTINE